MLDNEKRVELIEILRNRIGLNVSKIKASDIDRILDDYYRNFTSFDELVNFLKNGSVELPLYQNLISNIVVSETFFFRHFSEIENEIFDDILERNFQSKSLKIWCAGCSTGEEPYSVAMALQSKSHDLSDWDIRIIATDLCQENLDKAWKGEYSEWAFRQTPNYIKHQFFTESNGAFKVKDELRKWISFKIHNLAEYDFPNPIYNLYDFDIILCRNVLIYFEVDSIKKLSSCFFNTLKKDAYLVIGASEPSFQLFDDFTIDMYKDSIVYRKNVRDKAKSPEQKQLEVCRRINLAESYYLNKEYSFARTTLEDLRYERPEDVGVLYLSALIEANERNHRDVKYYCNKIFNLNPNFAYSYYLLGLILKEEKLFSKAEQYFKRCIAQDGSFYFAHLELAQLYACCNKIEELKKLENQLSKKLIHHNNKDMVGYIDMISVENVKTAMQTILARHNV